jgi:hypothetical protein
MEVAKQVSPVEVVDRQSPNLLTLPMVDNVVDAASRVKWKEEAGTSFPRQSVERSIYDLEYVRRISEDASPSMRHAYEHVASDMVRRMNDGIGRAVASGEATIASPADEAVLTDPVRVQRDMGLQREEKGPGLAQPLFETRTTENSFRTLNGIVNRIAGHLRDEEGRQVFDAVGRLDFAVEERRASPGADKPRDERTGEEQRTLASYNAIATEGMVKAAGGLAAKAALLSPGELEVVQATISASDRRAERGSELDVKAPEHVAERRGQIHAAMAASMQR